MFLKKGRKRYRSFHNISHIVLEIIKGVGVFSTFPEKYESAVKLQALILFLRPTIKFLHVQYVPASLPSSWHYWVLAESSLRVSIFCPTCQLWRLLSYRLQYFLQVSWAPRGAMERDTEVFLLSGILKEDSGNKSLGDDSRNGIRRPQWCLPSQTWGIQTPVEREDEGPYKVYLPFAASKL